MATEEIAQETLLEECRHELAWVNDEARRLARGLRAEQLAWVPPDGGWSVAQVFSHLATANESYLSGMRAAVAGKDDSTVPRQRDSWKPSFFGRLLLRSLEPTSRRSMPSPRIWRPGPDHPAAALQTFIDSQAQIAEVVRRAQHVDLTHARLSSPVSRLIRINLGDAFRILLAHDRRHLGQIGRIMSQPGFPATPDPPSSR